MTWFSSNINESCVLCSFIGDRRFPVLLCDTVHAFETIRQGRGRCSAFRVNGDSDSECARRSRSFSRLVALLAWTEEAGDESTRNQISLRSLRLHVYQAVISCDDVREIFYFIVYYRGKLSSRYHRIDQSRARKYRQFFPNEIKYFSLVFGFFRGGL